MKLSTRIASFALVAAAAGGPLIVGGSPLGPDTQDTLDNIVVASAECPECTGNDVEIRGRINYAGKLIANALYRATPAKAPF